MGVRQRHRDRGSAWREGKRGQMGQAVYVCGVWMCGGTRGGAIEPKHNNSTKHKTRQQPQQRTSQTRRSRAMYAANAAATRHTNAPSAPIESPPAVQLSSENGPLASPQMPQG